MVIIISIIIPYYYCHQFYLVLLLSSLLFLSLLLHLLFIFFSVNGYPYYALAIEIVRASSDDDGDTKFADRLCCTRILRFQRAIGPFSRLHSVRR